MPPLILASASPRRRQLLESLGLALRILPADVDESLLPGEEPGAYALRVSEDKALTAFSKLQAEGEQELDEVFILAADTVVSINGEVLGKPTDFADFQRIMQRLSGRWHQVHTAVLLWHRGGLTQRLVQTKVRFIQLSPEQIMWYWETGEPADKAGGYGIQGAGGALVNAIEGSHSNVVGLPLNETLELLSASGFPLPWASKKANKAPGAGVS